MDDELLDLVPLFLSEARERVDHLLELAPQIEGSPGAVVEARREFHTLKGSCRMLKLPALAELCHQGEELLASIGAGTSAQVTSLLDRLSGLLEIVARGEEPPATLAEAPTAAPGTAAAAPYPEGADGGSEADSPAQPAAPAAPAQTPGDSRPIVVPVAVDDDAPEPGDVGATEHRISARAADQLAAGAADLRIRALTGVVLAERAGQLAKLAEGGVSEVQPEQVLAMVSSALRQLATEVDANQRRLLQRAEEQLDTLLALQLQPLRPFLLSLARHTRELARTLGKDVQVELEGGEARLDRRISAELHGAFVHLVRNAVDHGVERPEVRRAAGKPERGRVRITATSLGDRVEIAVADDGAGIDPREVVAAAKRSGVLAADAEPTDTQALQLVLRAGFSTRQRVSELSGRGVGLDAVTGAVRRLGGEIWIESTPGVGTRVHVVVPAARRGERVLVLRVGFSRLALVRSAVASITRLDREALVDSQGQWLVRLRERLVPVLRLSDMLGEEPVEEPVLLEVQAVGVSRYLVVGEVEGVEEVLVRPFSSLVPAPALYTAVALLASGEPVPVLSTRALGEFRPEGTSPARGAARPVRLRVLLVEDSLVTREMERRLLEDEGFDVTAVPGAREALHELAEGSFDCVVTDIEMPEMTGLELTRKLRGMERFAHLPILVVSTLDRPEDRLAGLQAGADAYLSKQELQAHKIGAVIRRLGGPQ